MHLENIYKVTQNTTKMAVERAKKLKINKIIVTSCSGKIASLLANFNL